MADRSGAPAVPAADFGERLQCSEHPFPVEGCPRCFIALHRELTAAAEALWSAREALQRAHRFPHVRAGFQADTEPSKARGWTLDHAHGECLRLHFMVRTVLLSLGSPGAALEEAHRG